MVAMSLAPRQIRIAEIVLIIVAVSLPVIAAAVRYWP